MAAPKLELGATYDVYVTDDDTGERYGPFHVEAYPNCTRGVRDGLKCNYVSADTFARTDTDLEACLGQDNPEAAETEVIMGEAVLRSLPWPDIESRDGEDDRDLVWVVDGGVVGQRSQTCQAWSRSGSSYRRVPCDTKLPVFCQTDVKIVTSQPTENNIRVQPGSTHILLRWEDEPDSGWVMR